MKNTKILVYGAMDYTGELLVRHLLKKGFSPVLAARSESVKTLGNQLNCETRVFGIHEAKNFLNYIKVLVNMAGPFSLTQPESFQAEISFCI